MYRFGISLSNKFLQKVENEQSIFDPVTGGKAKGNKKKSRDDDAPGMGMLQNVFHLQLIVPIYQACLICEHKGYF